MVGKNEKAPALLAGGNPQIAKAEGDAPVQAYIAAMPAEVRRNDEAEVAIRSGEAETAY